MDEIILEQGTEKCEEVKEEVLNLIAENNVKYVVSGGFGAVIKVGKYVVKLFKTDR